MTDIVDLTQQIVHLYATLPGEVGVTNKSYKVGDIRRYGALASASNNLTAINNAITSVLATTLGQQNDGEVWVPYGNFSFNGTIAIGDGTGNRAIVLRGYTGYSSSNFPLTLSKLTQTSMSADSLVINLQAGQSNTVIVRGVQLIHTAGHTGKGIYFAGQAVGCPLEYVTVTSAGTGITYNAAHYPQDLSFDHVTTWGCGVGLQFTGAGVNLISFKHCYFQSCTTAGLLVDPSCLIGSMTGVASAFQSNTGPGLRILGRISRLTWLGGWWEFPGTDMIEVGGTGASAAGGLWQATFIGTHFDGSGGAGGRHVINNKAAAASQIRVDGITYIGCDFANLNGGKIHNLVATDPANSSDPGFANWRIINCFGAGDLDGNFTATSYPNQFNEIASKDFTTSHVLGTSIPYRLNRSDVVTQKAPLDVTSITEDAWTAGTPLNAWANAGGTSETAGYFKSRNGTVHVKGTVSGGTVSSGTAVLQLPVGMRPSADRVFYGGPGNSLKVVASTGGITLNGAGTSPVSLDDIVFRP